MNSQEKWFENIGYEIEVIKADPCRAEHNEGEKFVLDSYRTPEGLCIEAFHDMYPLLFAGRINGDFSILGSENTNERIYTCPSRAVLFKISRFYQCNVCGYKTEKEELKKAKRTFEQMTLDVFACLSCYENLIH